MSRDTQPAEVADADGRPTDEFFSLVYDELRRLAAARLSSEAPGNTLQPTALVHEAYLRLTRASQEGGGPRWQGRAHFFAAAAEAMRRILIDAARRKKCEKHGGGRERQPLDADLVAGPEVADDLLALDEALAKLAACDPQVAELVSLRYFSGLTLNEAAGVLGVSPRTAGSYWAFARVWIQAEIERGAAART